MRIEGTFCLEKPLETGGFTLEDVRETYTDAYAIPSHTDALVWFQRELKAHTLLWAGDLSDGFRVSGIYRIIEIQS